MSRGRVREKDDNYIQTQCIHVVRLRGILSVITAGCPMVGTPINLVRLGSLIRPSLISPQTKLIGVPTIGLPAVITLKIPLNQQSYAATILIQCTKIFVGVG